MERNAAYGPTILRIGIGLLFLVAGLLKLSDPAMIATMLQQIGLPAAIFFGWLLLIAEISCGAALLLGWKVKYAVWPPIVILLGALVFVHIPSISQSPLNVINVLFHLLGIATLASLFVTGPGAHAVES